MGSEGEHGRFAVQDAMRRNSIIRMVIDGLVNEFGRWVSGIGSSLWLSGPNRWSYEIGQSSLEQYELDPRRYAVLATFSQIS